MTRERNAGADDLHRFLATALQSQAREMFPDGTPAPPLRTRGPARRRGWPSVAVAAVVTAVALVAGLLVPATGPLTPAAGGDVEMGPPCELDWTDSASRVEFTLDAASGQVWRVWEQVDPDYRFCLSVDLAGGGSLATSVSRHTQMLQSAALVSVDGRNYLWGLVTPAATSVAAEDASGRWSATWTQAELHALPSALGVFVTAVDGAGRPITVTASSSDAGPDSELVVTGS